LTAGAPARVSHDVWSKTVKITTRQEDTVLVVEIAGQLDTQSSGEASDRLSEIVDNGHKKVLLNLEQLSFISSAGMRVILRTSRSLEEQAGKLKVCGASGLVTEVFTVAGFNILLNLSENEASALEEF
jgi:anti-sigma B factor antagonist